MIVLFQGCKDTVVKHILLKVLLIPLGIKVSVN